MTRKSGSHVATLGFKPHDPNAACQRGQPEVSQDSSLSRVSPSCRHFSPNPLCSNVHQIFAKFPCQNLCQARFRQISIQNSRQNLVGLMISGLIGASVVSSQFPVSLQSVCNAAKSFTCRAHFRSASNQFVVRQSPWTIKRPPEGGEEATRNLWAR